MQSMLSDHYGIELEINNKKIAGKCLNIGRLNNILINNACVKEGISRENF